MHERRKEGKHNESRDKIEQKFSSYLTALFRAKERFMWIITMFCIVPLALFVLSIELRFNHIRARAGESNLT